MGFSEDLQNWCNKVINTYNNVQVANTDYSTVKVIVYSRQMIQDGEKLINEAFDLEKTV